MTTTQKIAARFFLQTVILLLLYGVAALISALKFLSPDDSLFTVLPYQQASGLANILLNLAALTGLVGGGVYVAGQHRAAENFTLRLVSWVWTVLLILSVLAGIFGMGEGRNLLELPVALDILTVAALIVILLPLLPAALRVPTLQIWCVGLVASIVAILIGLITPGDFGQERVLRGLAVGINIYLAYPLMAIALGYWLMHRFSNLTPAWLDRDIYVAGGLVLLAGGLVILSTLFPVPEWIGGIGGLALGLAPILYAMIAARCYPALTRRNPTHTLGAHWFTFSLLLYLLTFGLLAALGAASAVREYTLGTRLSDLQTTMVLLAAVMMGLGVINQASAEIRGQNWRITGLTPFWLVVLGVLVGGLALGAAGVVQVYLERILSIGYLDTQTLLVPLYTGWTMGLLVLLLGFIVYALGFWARRPGR
ncbi:MAG: hypothetical protein R3E39_14935 [Anaerolineae bacterium]